MRGTGVETLFTLVVFGFLILLTVFLVMRWGYYAALFEPTREMEWSPTAEFPEVREVRIRVGDEAGSSLCAWWMPPPEHDSPVILYFHGRNSNISSRRYALLLARYLRCGM